MAGARAEDIVGIDQESDSMIRKVDSNTQSTEVNSSDEGIEANNFPVYKAKYSGVDVYELAHPTGSVMKRKSDNWVNATHILKAAKFAKAKRTRILEKDVMGKEHEKIQGGFGKYQGTWVPKDVAVEISLKYNVYEELKNLLDYFVKEGEAEPELAPKHTHAVKKDNKSNITKESVSSSKKKKITSERAKKDKITTSLDLRTASEGSLGNLKKDITNESSLNNNNSSLRDFLPEDSYLNNGNLLLLAGKRSYSDLEEFDAKGNTSPKHRKPVKLQRSNTNKNSLMVADPHHSSSKLNSPISNHNMLQYLTSSMIGNTNQMPIQASRTNSIKLPSLVAAANVALSPNYNNASSIKFKPNPQTYSPLQTQAISNISRPSSRINSYNGNGVSIKTVNGMQSATEDIHSNLNGLLPSISALSSHKRNLTYSPPIFNKPYLSNTPSFLQTPRVTNGGSKHVSSNYRQTPLRIDDGLSSEIEPMTPFFNSKQLLHQPEELAESANSIENLETIPKKNDNVLLHKMIQSILSGEKTDLEKIKNNANFAHLQSFKVINCPIDSMGNTLLHLASGTGSAEILDFLLTYCEVNPFQTNKRGESCVMQAFIFKNCHEKKCLKKILDIFGRKRLDQILKIRDNTGNNVLHLIINFCIRYSKGSEYLKILINELDAEFLKELLVQQSFANADTPLHLCQRLNDYQNFQLIVDSFKEKFDNNYLSYSNFLNNYLYEIKNKDGETCMKTGNDVDQHTDEVSNTYFLKFFSRINCEIIPKVQNLLMEMLNKRQQEYSRRNFTMIKAEKELMLLEHEKTKLNKINNEIDEMKFMLELNNLHNEICLKKLDTLDPIDIESNKTDMIVSEDEVKIDKLRDLNRILNKKSESSRKLYIENRDIENEQMIINCKKLVSKYMEVDIESINEQLIEKMIQDL